MGPLLLRIPVEKRRGKSSVGQSVCRFRLIGGTLAHPTLGEGSLTGQAVITGRSNRSRLGLLSCGPPGKMFCVGRRFGRQPETPSFAIGSSKNFDTRHTPRAARSSGGGTVNPDLRPDIYQGTFM